MLTIKITRQVGSPDFAYVAQAELVNMCYVSCATETSRNITARVIERDTSGEIYYFQKIPEGSELADMVANLVTKNDANFALPPRFRQALIESPL
ncbi:hypothetical protein TNCV_2615781 [Trichonephila clavipes]|nr:hypothetical protein TNCV_2615781 [Trichonephila clavipes]